MKYKELERAANRISMWWEIFGKGGMLEKYEQTYVVLAA